MKLVWIILLICLFVICSLACETTKAPAAKSTSDERPATIGSVQTTSKPPITTAVTTKTTTSPKIPGTTTADYWSDIPRHFQASKAQIGTWSVPLPQGNWTSVRWTYFETPAALPEIRNLYKGEMPKPQYGWTQESWKDEGDISISYWIKNNGTDVAMVWITRWQAGTFIAVAKGSR